MSPLDESQPLDRCKHCGAKISPDDVICPKCGADI